MEDQKAAAPKGRPRTTDPAHILDVATDAYWHADPADVSVNAICRLAGVSKPSLYREFGSEDGLTLAVIDRYAERVLSDVFTLLEAAGSFAETLDALVAFACDDPRMATGCLFYKMRNGKHRLGPETRARVDALDAAAREAYERFLRERLAAGEWQGRGTVEVSARYLSEQVGLAITQRASGESSEDVRASLTLALSVFTR